MRSPRPADYDSVAAFYDAYYGRPVDHWEDVRLAELLRPFVDDRAVLDLGCGTGWVLDNLEPAAYVGVDASSLMLEALHEKHTTIDGPRAETVQAFVGEPGWLDEVAVLAEGVEVVTATWSAHEFGALNVILHDLHELLGGEIDVLLHGSGPRYANRAHYVLNGNDRREAYKRFTPEAARAASGSAALWRGAYGTGALPDRLAISERAWKAALVVPARWHYAFVAHWTLR